MYLNSHQNSVDMSFPHTVVKETALPCLGSDELSALLDKHMAEFWVGDDHFWCQNLWDIVGGLVFLF